MKRKSQTMKCYLVIFVSMRRPEKQIEVTIKWGAVGTIYNTYCWSLQAQHYNNNDLRIEAATHLFMP